MTSKKQKGSVLIWLIIIVVAGIVYWKWDSISNKVSEDVLQKESSLADWQTYTNEEYGFEVKYPSDWELLSTSDSNNVDLIPLANKLAEQPADNSGIVNIRVEDNSQNLKITTWLEESPKYYSEDEAETIQKELEEGKRTIGIGYSQNEIEIASKEVFDQYVNGPGGSNRYVFIPLNNKVIVISLASDFHFTSNETDERISGLMNTFDQILSTFKFLK